MQDPRPGNRSGVLCITRGHRPRRSTSFQKSSGVTLW
nr:MAG TPA: hypothetical protein [Caudoviricetes sp.]